MSDFLIETKQLTKIYGEQTAVNSVNLHVKKVGFMVCSDATVPEKQPL